MRLNDNCNEVYAGRCASIPVSFAAMPVTLFVTGRRMNCNRCKFADNYSAGQWMRSRGSPGPD